MDEVFTTPEQLTADWRRRRPADVRAARDRWAQIAKPPWSVLGQAIDLRIRYGLSASHLPAESVEEGIQMAVRRRRIERQVADELHAELKRVIGQHRPSDRSVRLRLPDGAEERLLRLCYVMSWFEAFYRNPMKPAPMLASSNPRSIGLDDLLGKAPADCVCDLLEQVHLASAALHELRASAPETAVRTGPVFCGSEDVGGADADLIVDGFLIDIKATTAPSRIRREHFRQLLGYVLLDYDNTYNIQRAGFYLTRYGALIGWDLPHLLDLAGATEPITALRQELYRRYEPIRERRAAASEASLNRIAAVAPEIAERIRKSIRHHPRL